MPRRYKRRRPSSQKSILASSKSSKNQQRQILDLSKRVSHNSKILRGVTYKVTHSTRLALGITGTTAQPYRALFCNNLSGMNLQFSALEEAKGGIYNGDGRGRMHLSFNIASNTEPTPMPLSIFLVSPKNQKVSLSIGMSVAGSAFNLINGTDYVNNLGITYMNKKRWNIHKNWSVNLLPIQTLGGTTPWAGDLKPIFKKWSMKNLLKLNNRRGTWNDPLTGATDESVNPNQRVMLVVFNNNISQPATFPILSGQVIHTAYTSE